MKRRAETATVFSGLERALNAGEAAAVATLVGVEGSSYRRPGARMLVTASGRIQGGISGGCLEEDVRLHALAALGDRQSTLLHYDTASVEEGGLGLGCDGRIDILIRPFHPTELGQVATLRGELCGAAAVGLSWLLDGRAAGAWAAVGGAASTGAVDAPQEVVDAAHRARTDGDGLRATVEGSRIFAERLVAAPLLVICGGGDDSLPLASVAASMGFEVMVLDHRPAYLDPARFPDGTHVVHCRPDGSAPRIQRDRETMVVIKTHSYAADEEWLRLFLEQPVLYVGVMGPRARIDRLRSSVGDDPRLYGPVGLDIGAQGPEQIAVAVAAELVAVRAQRKAAHLRDRRLPIRAGA